MEAGQEQVLELSRELEVSPLISRLLVQRGLSDAERAREFLNPRLEGLHDPGLMKGMVPAVGRIFRAIHDQEKILIYGDYDVDGITSTVVLKRALEILGGRADFYIPKRLEEGYGLKKEIIEKGKTDGVSLIISADTGIRAFEACQAACHLGLDLIVTDHHLPDSSLPPAYAILNPHQIDCPYPEKNLAAVGVIFKLVHALFRRAGKEHLVRHFLKLVAIGTIADIVPLTGENRIIVKFGLEGLSRPHNVGLRALLSGVGLEGEIKLSDIGFRVAPRINAVTRMGGGREVVELFSAQDPHLANSIVRTMNEKNSRRRQEEQRVLTEIDRRFKENPVEFEKDFLVVAGEEWHRGVIGIVASRLVERFYRPVLVISTGENTGQGSGRSIPGFHLLDALDHCRGLFEQYGGHAQAVGFTLRKNGGMAGAVQELSEQLNAYAHSRLTAEQLSPSLAIDATLPIESISFPFYDQLEQLAPFGPGNPLPVFASNKVGVMGGPWVLKEQHLKFQVRSNGSLMDAIWWKNGSAAGSIAPGLELDLAYTLTRDTYQGEKLLLTIQDLHA